MSQGEDTRRRIEAILTARLRPLHLQVRDDSERHAGHPGAAAGGGHFEVVIVSPLFEGAALLDRHRLVHGALAGLLTGAIHALALKTIAPSEWTGTRA